MSDRLTRRLRAWFIVREIEDTAMYLSMPLLTGGKSWTDNTRLASPYWNRAEAADVLRVLVRPVAPEARIVPVWL